MPASLAVPLTSTRTPSAIASGPPSDLREVDDDHVLGVSPTFHEPSAASVDVPAVM
jgi:hypothetical protein